MADLAGRYDRLLAPANPYAREYAMAYLAHMAIGVASSPHDMAIRCLRDAVRWHAWSVSWWCGHAVAVLPETKEAARGIPSGQEEVGHEEKRPSW